MTAGDDTMVVHASRLPFDATVERLATLAKDAGLTVFARIDHRAAALEVGLDMPPTVVLLIGNPHGGTPAMLAAPDAALDLPLRVLVREEHGGSGAKRAVAVFRPIGPLLQGLGVPAKIAGKLDALQRSLVDAL